MPLPFLKPRKQRCTCFIQHGEHHFVEDLASNGESRYHCMFCGAPAEEAIAAEQEYTVAWNAGEESAYLKRNAGIPGRWGVNFPWRS